MASLWGSFFSSASGTPGGPLPLGPRKPPTTWEPPHPRAVPSQLEFPQQHFGASGPHSSGESQHTRPFEVGATQGLQGSPPWLQRGAERAAATWGYGHMCRWGPEDGLPALALEARKPWRTLEVLATSYPVTSWSSLPLSQKNLIYPSPDPAIHPSICPSCILSPMVCGMLLVSEASGRGLQPHWTSPDLTHSPLPSPHCANSPLATYSCCPLLPEPPQTPCLRKPGYSFSQATALQG